MESSISALAEIIQIAVAPVFLLAGIAGFLNVMSGRLGRIVDRGRVLEAKIVNLEEGKVKSFTKAEYETLRRRSKLINWSIAMCTASGLMVCIVVVSLFVGDYWDLNIAFLVISMFVLALILVSLSAVVISF